jgi:tetratricopeptide (TPR) repeat protein
MGAWYLDDEQESGEARGYLEAVLEALDEGDLADDDARLDALEGLALLEMTSGNGRKAAAHLRPALKLCQAAGSVEDTLKVRLNLGLALCSTDEPGPRGDGHAHLQIVVDEARDHGLEPLRLAALMGLVGVYNRKGAADGALERALEIARGAVEQGRPELYAAAAGLMADVYQSQRDFPMAFHTLARARAALRITVSPEAGDLMDPYLDALAERMGPERYQAMCEKIVAAQEARKRLESE